MEKKEIKVGDRIIPVEAGKVIPMTKEEWKKFQKQMKVERDYFYMIGNKKYIHYEDEDYVRVSDIEQELDKAKEEGCEHNFDLDNRCIKCGVRGVRDMTLEPYKIAMSPIVPDFTGRTQPKVEWRTKEEVDELLDKAREEGFRRGWKDGVYIASKGYCELSDVEDDLKYYKKELSKLKE
jgi:hypothetical protein